MSMIHFGEGVFSVIWALIKVGGCESGCGYYSSATGDG